MQRNGIQFIYLYALGRSAKNRVQLRGRGSREGNEGSFQSNLVLNLGFNTLIDVSVIFGCHVLDIIAKGGPKDGPCV